MNDINPYTQPDASAASEEAKQKTHTDFKKNAAEVSHNAFRGVFAFLAIGLIPAFIIPALTELFEEFGVELPTVTQFVIQYSHVVRQYSFVVLPIMFVLLAGIEFGFFAIPSGKLKTIGNLAYWLFLILVIGLAFTSLMIPLSRISAQMSEGLAAAIM